jgi:hypothetical protein
VTIPLPPKREPIVPVKVRAAIEWLLVNPPDLVAAAKHAGLASAARLREELKKPHVLRYARQEKQLALESFCLSTPAILRKIAEESANDMARLGAVKTAEALRVGSVEAIGGVVPPQPGLVVVIEVPGQPDRILAPPMPAPMIDVTPERQPDGSYTDLRPAEFLR